MYPWLLYLDYSIFCYFSNIMALYMRQMRQKFDKQSCSQMTTWTNPMHLSCTLYDMHYIQWVRKQLHCTGLQYNAIWSNWPSLFSIPIFPKVASIARPLYWHIIAQVFCFLCLAQVDTLHTCGFSVGCICTLLNWLLKIKWSPQWNNTPFLKSFHRQHTYISSALPGVLCAFEKLWN